MLENLQIISDNYTVYGIHNVFWSVQSMWLWVYIRASNFEKRACNLACVPYIYLCSHIFWPHSWYTNPNCQRNKVLWCNFLMWQDNTMKLRFLLPTQWFWSPYKQISRSVAIRWILSPGFNTLFSCCTCRTGCYLQNHMYCCKPQRSPNKMRQRKLISKSLLWHAWASNSEDRRLECSELAAVRRCHVCCVVRGLRYLDYGRSFNDSVRSV